jgi:hypothetical protein
MLKIASLYRGKLRMPRAYSPTTVKHCDDGNGTWTDYTRMAWNKKPAFRVYLLGTINSKPPCTNRGASHGLLVVVQCENCFAIRSASMGYGYANRKLLCTPCFLESWGKE